MLLVVCTRTQLHAPALYLYEGPAHRAPAPTVMRGLADGGAAGVDAPTVIRGLTPCAGVGATTGGIVGVPPTTKVRGKKLCDEAAGVAVASINSRNRSHPLSTHRAA